VATRTKLTYEDYEAFPDDGNRYEIIDGEVCVSPPPITAHQWASAELTWLLGSHIRQYELGRLFYAPFAVMLSPHDVFEPDVVFISEDRMVLLGEKGLRGAPDLCIEISSPSTRTYDRTVKRERYAQFGVDEYWIVDPDTKTVEVFVLEAGAYRLQAIARADDRVASSVLPQLDLRASALFMAP
jgi:Uma2 family endonuclease